MGVAAGDYSGDGLDDLFVTNSRGQLHAAYESRAVGPFADARPEFSAALGQRSTGWGATWVDLDLDGRLELALANGAIPVTNLVENADRLQVVSTANGDVRPLRVGAVAPRNGRGLAAADFDNDGDLDLAVGSIGGRLQLLRNDGAKGHWLEVELRTLRPRDACDDHAARRHERSCGRRARGAATSRRRIRASTSGSATRVASMSSSSTRATSRSKCATSAPTVSSSSADSDTPSGVGLRSDTG